VLGGMDMSNITPRFRMAYLGNFGPEFKEIR
jgi:hypothetical protein